MFFHSPVVNGFAAGFFIVSIQKLIITSANEIWYFIVN